MYTNFSQRYEERTTFLKNLYYEIYKTNKAKSIKLIDALNQFVDYGFSEFLMTNISKDGMLEGPDIVTLKEATKINNVNIIASGGVSNSNDLVNIKNCNPFGVILGKVLYENLVTIEEAKKI